VFQGGFADMPPEPVPLELGLLDEMTHHMAVIRTDLGACETLCVLASS
jgi:hypothetical protein